MSAITSTGNLTIAQGNLKRTFVTTRGFDFVSSTPTASSGVVSVATTSTGQALVLQGVSTCGWARFENLDATNYVEIGVSVSSVFYPFIKLKPTEFCIVRLGSNAPYARANTLSVQLDYEIFTD